MKTPIIFLLFALLSSCAFHNGMVGGDVPQANTQCVKVGLAHGSSKTFKVLGIGSTNRDALVLDAKEDMYNNFPLTEEQQFAFVTVDFKRSFFPFFSSTQVVVSADVLDCSGDAEAPRTVLPPKPKAYPGSQLEPGKTVATSQERYKIVSLGMTGLQAQRIGKPNFRIKELSYDEILGALSPWPVRLQGTFYILAPGDTIRYQQEGAVNQAVVIDPSRLYIRPLGVEEGRQFALKPDDVIIPEY